MKVLLLSSSFEPIDFLSFKKAIKLVLKEKVEIVSVWKKNDRLVEIQYGRGSMPFPAIIRLKYYTPRHVKRDRFNRPAIFKRDNLQCQYCAKKFKIHELTIDHVIPKHMGGGFSWENCVAACSPCNSKKDNNTPKMAKMKLLKRPKKPARLIWHEYQAMTDIHEDWEYYILSNKY